MMFRLQRPEDLRVGFAHCAAVAVGKIDATCGQADVIEDTPHLRCRNTHANIAVDGVDQPGRFFEARAGLRAHMQTELAGVHSRKEVFAKEWDERQAAQAEQQKDAGKDYTVFDALREQAFITLLHRLERMLKLRMQSRKPSWLLAAFGLMFFCIYFFRQKVHHERGNDRSGEKVRREQREDYGFGERYEEVS